MKDLRTWYPWEPPSGPLDPTSPSLVLGYQSGDAESWKRLVDIYGPVVYHVYLARVASPDREDVFQEVFSTAWKSRERFTKAPGRPSFRAWLHRIAENTMLNYRRGARRHHGTAPVGGDDHREMMEQVMVHDPPTSTIDQSGSSPDTADSWKGSLDRDHDIVVEGVNPDGARVRILVRRQVLMMVLRELDGKPQTRDLALRQIINGESAEAAARALGTNAGAAYTAKSRVLKRAREILQELGELMDDSGEPPEQCDGAEP
jgi:RNA polymerase sigma-70 factor, ECF subfamily